MRRHNIYYYTLARLMPFLEPATLELLGERHDPSAMTLAAEDLDALIKSDPSHRGLEQCYLESCSPFIAVSTYRLAHACWAREPLMAMKLCHAARVATGVEIHPGATIGRRFVVDHGTGTVIGETTEIGEDCTVLNGVIIGSRRMNANMNVKRHPTIGHRVSIGAYSQLLGNIVIGDDVRIHPWSVITRDLHARARAWADHARPIEPPDMPGAILIQ
ncbi:serine O-acetyltransferase [uncultured Kushneria sp.]|uniref:serine O-acetyltransferase n=1 Tax=uncultured Kushneria sp. TaxID=905033 RepID=UPI00262404A9|nr:serine O-acetyltransferase [uncultured Kushneria sp.]